MSAFCEADTVQQVIGALGRVVHTLELEWNLDVFPRRQSWDQLKALEDESDFLAPQLCALVLVHCREVVTIEDHAPASRGIETSEQSKESRLSAPRRSDDCDEAALRDLEGDASQNGDLLIAASVFACNFTCNEHSISIVLDGAADRTRRL